jgi:hypothetical protein
MDRQATATAGLRWTNRKERAAGRRGEREMIKDAVMPAT